MRLIKIFVPILAVSLMMTGCHEGYYNDDQVYIVDKDESRSNKDQLIDWLEVKGPEPFRAHVPAPSHLLPNETWIAGSKNTGTYYTIEDAAVRDINRTQLFGVSARPVDVTEVSVNDGKRQTILTSVPYVQSSTFLTKMNKLYLLAGSDFYVYDRDKNVINYVNDSLDESFIVDYFVAPTEKNKLYLEPLGIEGGLTYYADSGRGAPLYQAWDSLYYKRELERPYYYATQWRRAKKSEGEDALYTVIADSSGRVVRILGTGAFQDAYRDKALLLGSHRFGLTYIANINQYNKKTELTSDYIYEARFLPNGYILWISDATDQQESLLKNEKPFRLHVADQNGKEVYRHDVTGSQIRFSRDGLYAYGSGAGEEIFNVKALQMESETPVYGANQSNPMSTQLANFTDAYVGARLGRAEAFTELKNLVTDERFLNRLASMIEKEIPAEKYHIEAYYAAPEYDWGGQNATTKLKLVTVTSGGHSFNEHLKLDILLDQGVWKVWHVEQLGMEG